MVFSRFLGVDIAVGVIIGMAIVAFFAVLGGMKGITWTQVAQYGVLIFAYLIPAVAIATKLTGNPIPQLSFTFSDIAARLNGIQVELGFTEYTQPFQTKSFLDVFCITFALMTGTAGLPHIIVRFYTVPSVRAARYSAGWALLFIALLYTTAPAIAAFARYNLINTIHDQTIEEARSLDWIQSWEATGLLTLEDKNGDGRLQLSKDAETNEIGIDRDIIVLSTPEVAGLAPWVIALVAAGGLAAALSTAAGLLLVISSSIAHDVYARLINKQASERRRLVVGRVMIFAAILVAGYFGINPPGFVAEVVAFAFGLAAASFFPIILLGIFDKRTNPSRRDHRHAGRHRLHRLLHHRQPLLRNARLVLRDQRAGDRIGRAVPQPGRHDHRLAPHATASQEIQDLVESVRIPKGAGAATSH